MRFAVPKYTKNKLYNENTFRSVNIQNVGVERLYDTARRQPHHDYVVHPYYLLTIYTAWYICNLFVMHERPSPLNSVASTTTDAVVDVDAALALLHKQTAPRNCVCTLCRARLVS